MRPPSEEPRSRSRQQAMHARTDGRTARKHNASRPICWVGGKIKICPWISGSLFGLTLPSSGPARRMYIGEGKSPPSSKWFRRSFADHSSLTIDGVSRVGAAIGRVRPPVCTLLFELTSDWFFHAYRPTTYQPLVFKHVINFFMFRTPTAADKPIRRCIN